MMDFATNVKGINWPASRYKIGTKTKF